MDREVLPSSYSGRNVSQLLPLPFPPASVATTPTRHHKEARSSMSHLADMCTHLREFLTDITVKEDDQSDKACHQIQAHYTANYTQVSIWACSQSAETQIPQQKALISSHVPSEEGEASSEPAYPAKADGEEPLTLRKRTPPTPTVISRSRVYISNYPCTPES
ncbi:hypothetical protein J6590_016328 [Homalodisca vitripennis]|nr:hypothetical protein J6590_016328 [Homalodisca vitripennis]